MPNPLGARETENPRERRIRAVGRTKCIKAREVNREKACEDHNGELGRFVDAEPQNEKRHERQRRHDAQRLKNERRGPLGARQRMKQKSASQRKRRRNQKSREDARQGRRRMLEEFARSEKLPGTRKDRLRTREQNRGKKAEFAHNPPEREKHRRREPRQRPSERTLAPAARRRFERLGVRCRRGAL